MWEVLLWISHRIVRSFCRKYDASTRSPAACSPCARDATRSSRRWTPRPSATVPVDIDARDDTQILVPRRRDPTPASWRSRPTVATAYRTTATTKWPTASEGGWPRVRTRTTSRLSAAMRIQDVLRQTQIRRDTGASMDSPLPLPYVYPLPVKRKTVRFPEPNAAGFPPAFSSAQTIGHSVPADCRSVAVKSQWRLPIPDRGDVRAFGRSLERGGELVRTLLVWIIPLNSLLFLLPSSFVSNEALVLDALGSAPQTGSVTYRNRGQREINITRVDRSAVPAMWCRAMYNPPAALANVKCKK